MNDKLIYILNDDKQMYHFCRLYYCFKSLDTTSKEPTIQDLINYKHLENCHYNFVHYDSLDERGIDVALIYDSTAFEVTHSDVFRIQLVNEHGLPDYTRDILLVSGWTRLATATTSTTKSTSRI